MDSLLRNRIEKKVFICDTELVHSSLMKIQTTIDKMLFDGTIDLLLYLKTGFKYET